MAGHSTSPTSSVPDRVSVETHIERLRKVLEPALRTRQTEHLPLDPQSGNGDQAVTAGRISASEVIAPVPLPGFDNSQMDGFALRCEDVVDLGHSFSLPLAGTVPAGTAAPNLPAGHCVAIMTGAPIPSGADVVVPVEKTARGFDVLDAMERGGEVPVHFTGIGAEDLLPGRFIRRAGSDVAVGEVVLQSQEELTAAKMGLLAACGIAQVDVLERVRTLVMATGRELRRPGEPLGSGGLYDANAPLIRAVCQGFGHTVRTAMIASDVSADFQAALEGLLVEHHPHLIITAGGISAGAYEVVRQALAERGVQFGSVTQQPGGPQGWGKLEHPGGSAAVVALPGNPVSCAVSLETLLRPALVSLDPGCPAQRRIWVDVGEDLSSPLGVRQFRRVELRAHDDAVPTAVPIGGASSHLLGHLARAQALLELREEDTEVPQGTRREAILL
ncbi:molybdopterin molybdotransferase MoeA [Nesterenkonia natronophila]|uniref:Molybdopterin molybdenumtransferase n=1 Tax=Nesterenkonia natronophila TaxID=2174932 RepID=A0A3A4F4P5_9MICC|nr:gephyrin-like molybdotransferase Glp [Nesterenkonia natronophila]RJN32848.1 molybdopterin molybdenumtransferase MoeA [Nesterenkonia natronophila]